jgi:putative nucleotidyltransferase with HDIG domain
MSAVYRVRQFARAAGAWFWPGGTRRDQACLELLDDQTLPPAGRALFQAMPRYDRGHALAVFETLRRSGHTEPDLLAAALLHDAGKTVHPKGHLRLWHRVVSVLVRAWQPALLARLGQDRPGSWRRSFFVQAHHAELGAELARQVGCSPRTVALIRHHEDAPGMSDDPLLAVLQAADSRN